MNILVSANSNSIDSNTVEAVLIVLTPDIISLLLQRKKTFSELNDGDKVLSELSYHSDIHTKFFGYDEALDDLLDYGDNIINPSNIEEIEEIRCEGIYLKICNRGFHFTFRKKHCDYEYFTDIVTWQELTKDYEKE